MTIIHASRHSLKKLGVEEADETEHWLELIQESGLGHNEEKTKGLLKEAGEICKILTQTKDTLYRRKNA